MVNFLRNFEKPLGIQFAAAALKSLLSKILLKTFPGDVDKIVFHSNHSQTFIFFCVFMIMSMNSLSSKRWGKVGNLRSFGLSLSVRNSSENYRHRIANIFRNFLSKAQSYVSYKKRKSSKTS